MKNELNTKQIENLLQNFYNLKKQSDILTAQIKAIKDTLKSHADEVGMESGDYFMGETLKSRYDDLWKDKFDQNKLKADNIDLYNLYLKVGYTHQQTVNNPELI